MKLAEALARRADIIKEIENIATRLNLNSKVQEGEEPSEDVNLLLELLDNNSNELEDLIKKINHTNNESKENGVRIADLIAKRDALTKKIKILQNFANSASQRVDRYSNKEIRIVSSVNVNEIRKTIDSYSKELRMTENSIQEANWTIDLID